jgi:protein-S-isoprenylcysteine O-methyltransferase Ste14
MRLLIYLSFAFAFSEFLLMLFRNSWKTIVKTRKDRGSMIFIWVMITFGFTGGFILAKYDSWNIVNYIMAVMGSILMLTGIILRWLAIIQLGKPFTVDVAITDGAKLKQDGLYKKIRHPSYLGLLLIIAGFSLAMNSFYSFLVLFVPVVLAVIYRIRVEEKVLINEFVSDYSEYVSKTKKLIPGIF